MKRPRVMTPMGPLHLPVWTKDPKHGWCYSFADGEQPKWDAMARGMMGLPGQSHVPGGRPALEGLVQAMPLPDTSSRVLSMEAVALLLRIPSAREARKFLKRNRLDPVKAGRRFFIGKERLENFILAQEKDPTPAATYARSKARAGDLAVAKNAAADRLIAERRSGGQA